MKFAKPFGVLWTALALFGCATGTPASPPPDIVAYQLSPSLAPDNRIEALRVEMDFLGDEDGATNFRLPIGFAGQGDLWKNISDLQVTGGSLRQDERPGVYLIDHPPSGRLALSYRVTLGITHPPTTNDEQPYVPWIFGDWFFVNGQTVFARLNRPPSTPATFKWNGPADLVFASDLEHFSAPGAKGDLGAITRSAIIVSRDLRILSQGPTRLALHGKYEFSDAEFLAAAKILREERAFWGAPVDDPYFVAVGPLIPAPGTRGGIGGSGQHDGYSIAMTPYVPVGMVMQIFAHETFHAWNLENNNTPPEDTWMHEGFTDYYGTVLSFRAGVLSPAEFAANWNDFLISYAASPARTRTNAEITRDRWSDPDAERMHYLRGALIAALFDRRLRDASVGKASLDDVVRDQRKRGTGPSGPTARELFATIMAEHGLDVSADIATHIDSGAPIVLPENAFGPCLRVERTTMRVFDRGFDMEASIRAGMIATGVRADGPAYAAGLRDGMRLLQPLEGRLGDSTKESVWLAEANGEQRTLRWTPAGNASAQSSASFPSPAPRPVPSSATSAERLTI